MDAFLLGHLRWDSAGGCYATWELKPLIRARTETQAQQVADSHHTLFRAFPGHRFWLESLVVWADPMSMAERMLAGVDLGLAPGWASTASAALDEMQGSAFGQRRFFLTVKLSSTRQWLRTATRAALNRMLEAGGMAPLRPSATEIEAAAAAAARIEKLLPAEMEPAPVTSAVAAWLRRHHQTRMGEDLTVAADPVDDGDEPVMVTGASCGTVQLDPGGIAEMSGPGRFAAAAKHRWLIVTDDQGVESYQSHLVLAKVPPRLHWPDSEFLGRIDDTCVEVDYALVGQVRSAHEATTRNQNAKKRLTAQLDEVDSPDAGVEGLGSADEDRFMAAARVLGRYDHDFQNDDTLVEVEAVVIASVTGATPHAVEEAVTEFQTAEVNRSFRWARPVGCQENLWWAKQPGLGVPLPEVRQYRQITHSRTVGAAAVVISHQLGDATGIPVAVNRTSALQSPVLIEPFGVGEAFKQSSPSMGIVGAQGSGKTMLAKTWAGHMVDRGALLVATDTSPEREWTRFAASLDAPVTGVDLSNPTSSCDPLRIFEPHLAGPVAMSFLITLLDISATDPDGRMLAKVLRPDYLQQHQIGSLGGLQRHLRTAQFTSAESVADRIEVFSNASDANFAGAVFDEDLKPMDLSNNQVFIWGLYGMPLPTQEELASPHLFRQLPLQKLFGRACFALFATFAQQMQLGTDRPSLQNIDEYHAFAGCPEAHRVVTDMVRVGRHQRAAVSVQSQLPRDLLVLRDLLRVRFVFRPTDPDQADEMATFLGDTNRSPEAHTALVQDILTHNAEGRGAGLMRDAHDRIGRVKTFMPFTERRRGAASTAEPSTA